MDPIQAKYGDRAALMFVTTREGIDLSSKTVRDFQSMGGYVVVINPSTSDFKEVAKRISSSGPGALAFDIPGPRLPSTRTRRVAHR